MNDLVKSFLVGFVGTAAVLAASEASAQEAPPAKQVSGTVFTGIATLPEYEGADEQQVLPLAAGEIRWGERYLRLEGTSLRANILESDIVEFGPVANLTFGRDRKIGSTAVAALGVIDDAFEVGAFGALRFRSVLADGDELKLRLQGQRDVSDVHEGWTGQAAVSYRLPVSRRLTLTGETSLSFADSHYARTYFSVTPEGALASGLSVFEAGGGLKDVGASLTATYALSGRFTLLGYAGYRRLLGDFKDSPVVAREGSADQFSAGIGIGMSF